MTSQSAIVLDGDPSRRADLCLLLRFVDYDVQAKGLDCPCRPEDVSACIGHLTQPDINVVLLGRCPTAESLTRAFSTLQQWDPDLPVIHIRDADDPAPPPEVAAGVVATLTFPLHYQTLMQALSIAEVHREMALPPADRRRRELFRSLAGTSAAIQQIRHLIMQVANTDANVLILGESGTGKEVVARHLHYYSQRRGKPFVPVNCGAIPSELLESELFGHEKGAFTGAVSARQGRFEIAEGGTLFLDEIGDMSLPMQVKILRVLQERTFERVGSNRSVTADVRIVAATHRDLEQAILDGKFREDLYYRLNVFPIEMPSLRARLEDLPSLIDELNRRQEAETGRRVRMTAETIECLSHYTWPGNVRELANLIERLAILYPEGRVDVGQLPDKFRESVPRLTSGRTVIMPDLPEVAPQDALPSSGLDLKEHLNQIEYNLIVQAMRDSNGVVAHAARRLNLGRTTLVEKLRKYEEWARERAVERVPEERAG